MASIDKALNDIRSLVDDVGTIDVVVGRAPVRFIGGSDYSREEDICIIDLDKVKVGDSFSAINPSGIVRDSHNYYITVIYKREIDNAIIVVLRVVHEYTTDLPQPSMCRETYYYVAVQHKKEYIEKHIIEKIEKLFS